MLDKNPGSAVWGWFIENKFLYEVLKYSIERVPLLGMNFYAFIRASNEVRDFSNMITKIRDRVDNLITVYDFFI